MTAYVVVGLGGSGLSAVKFLTEQGHDVTVVDENASPSLADKLPASVATAFGGIDTDILLATQCIVISPGVDPLIDPVLQAKQANIPVISDVQLFIDALQARDKEQGKHTPIVAITGSNAKSTVTTLVGEMARGAGKVVGVGGNIGTPALELLNIPNMDMAVLELSSFQLEHITALGADVATVLNLSADHLDRHGDMANYLALKLRIFDQAKAMVVCTDDNALMTACQTANAGAGVIKTCGQIGESWDKASDFYLMRQADEILLCHQGDVWISADKLLIKGKHNLLNALSALALGQAVGLDKDSMLTALQAFAGLPHRCQFVAEVGDKAYFNDSKGTNIGSTLAALDGLGVVYGKRSLALIIGGQGKGQDFAELTPFADEFADNIYLIGQDKDIIKAKLAEQIAFDRLIDTGTLDVAVSLAAQSDARAVLLSPACASLDQFKNYNERGERFMALVDKLA